MSDKYLEYINLAVANVQKVIETVGQDYEIIVTADYGGHDPCHGTDLYEDMTIPMFFYGKDFEECRELHDVSILDIAPTIAEIMEIPKPREWEGKSLI